MSNSPYALAKNQLSSLVGYVKSKEIEDYFNTILTLVDDEVVEGAYINDKEDYILLTTKSIYWKSDEKVEIHFPFREVDTIYLEDREDKLFLSIRMHTNEIVKIPLSNDEAQREVALKYEPTNYTKAEFLDLVQNEFQACHQIPEICEWILSDNLNSARLKELKINTPVEEIDFYLLYLVLQELANETGSDSIGIKPQHPVLAILQGIDCFATREDLMESYGDYSSYPEQLIGMYMNDELSYFLVETDQIVDYRDGNQVAIKYSAIENFKIEEPNCIILDLKDGKNYLIPVEGKTDGYRDIDLLCDFLEFVTFKDNISNINSVDDLELYLKHKSTEFPDLLKLAQSLTYIIPEDLAGSTVKSGEFCRIVAITLTEPYKAKTPSQLNHN